MTHSARWFMDITQKIFTGMGAHTDPIFNQFVEEIEGLEDQDILHIQLAYGFAPEPITPKQIMDKIREVA